MTTTEHSPKPEAVSGPAAGRQRGVVVGVDGSPAGAIAALWAAEEAQRLGSPLTLVHAVHIRSRYPERKIREHGTFGPSQRPGFDGDSKYRVGG